MLVVFFTERAAASKRLRKTEQREVSQSASHIDTRQLKAFSKLRPWRVVAAIILDWAVIVAAILVCEVSGSWLVWLLVTPVIAGRMHALAVLIHEFGHYRFIKNKVLSDWIGDLLLAWPVGATIRGYRRSHLSHHRYLNTGKDPDWTIKLGTRMFTFPQEMQFAVLNLFGYFVGVSSLRDIYMAYVRLQHDDLSSRTYKLLRAGFYLLVAVVLTLAGAWTEYFFYWAIPYFTLFFLFLYIRSVADHFGDTIDYSSELTGTRTVIPYFWERWFFCPHHINYHIEHHHYPSVPFFNLPQLNAALMQNPAYAAEAHLTYGYVTGLLREVWLNTWRRDSRQSAAGGEVVQ
jgi:fatty acid desaturase